jgi:hypothetical protein
VVLGWRRVNGCSDCEGEGWGDSFDTLKEKVRLAAL